METSARHSNNLCALRPPLLRNQALDALWAQGLKGRALLKSYQKEMDAYLSACFSSRLDNSDGIALVALGGYGRGDLHPHADIDILLLYSSDSLKERVEVEDVASSIFYPIWDIGVELGHSVRDVNECIAYAETDFFFQVSVLDARLIVGDEGLFNNFVSAFNDKFVSHRRKEFVQQMLDHVEARLSRFGQHSYLLEPNIKESRGGLRDIQSMLWTAKVVFGLNGLSDMESAGLLIPEERAEIESAWDLLVQVRNQLHYCSNRKNDRLYFEYQIELTERFGHRDQNGMLAVEQFMSEVYSAMSTVTVANRLFFDHVSDVLASSNNNYSPQILETAIEVINGYIYLSDRELIYRRPHLIMRLFYQSAVTGLPIHYTVRKLIRSNLKIIEERGRYSKRIAKAFLDTLSMSDNPLPAIEAMLETGVLSAYIPEFAHLESLAQHDVYHTYTVDRHCLETVSQLAKLRYSEKKIFDSLKHPEILFLAGLLHDIGKGYGSGHADRGAKLVLDIGKRMGLDSYRQELLSFLVKNHLFLMDTAQRRDLEDENFILKCARHIENPERLNMLYLLSIADARATGPHVFTEWKAVLLQELFLKIAHLLERTDLIDPDRIQAVEWMKEQIYKLVGEDTDLDILPEDYLLAFTPEEICYHLKQAKSLDSSPCLIFPRDRGNCWQLLVIAKDSTGLLSKICGMLALHNLGVLGAQIFTWKDGTVVDLLELKSFLPISYEEQDWDALNRDLIKAVTGRIGIARRLEEKGMPVGTSRMPKGSAAETKVILDNKSSDFYTIIEIYASEHPGLLYDVTKVLYEFNINIHRAMIGPRVDQIVDVFYVLDQWGQKIEDPELQREIRLSLLYAVKGR